MPRVLAAAIVGLWTLVAIAPNLLALPSWPWIAGQARTPVDAATLFWAAGHLTSLLAAVGFCAVMFALVGKASRYVLLLTPFVAVTPLEALYILKYGQPTDATLIGVLASTNWREASEFVTGIVLVAVVCSLGLIAVGIALARVLRRQDLRWTTPVRILVPIAFAVIVAMVIAHEGGVGVALTRPSDSVPRAGGEVLSPLERAVARSYPLGIVIRYAEYAEQRRRVVAAAAMAADFRFGARQTAEGPSIVVLVIGESLRADHLGLNGYGRDTTPRLSAIRNLHSFRDATAAAGATRESIPYLLTRRPLGVDPARLPPERSIISAFGEAGYSTWWISTQAPFGAFETEVSAMAEEAGVRRFVNPAGYGKTSAFDSAALDALKDAMKGDSPRLMTVVHLLQAHWDYRSRYPASADVFQPSGSDGRVWSIYSRSEKTAIVNAFDNAVRYSDQVLAEMIESLAATGRPAVLLYMSDHGQALFEGSCLTAGHGVWSRTVFEVPLIVWLSPQYAARYPERAAALTSNSTRPVTAESVFPTLADLGNLAFDGAKRELSVANPDFRPGARSVTLSTRNWIDFDRELPQKDCAGPRIRQAGPR